MKNLLIAVFVLSFSLGHAQEITGKIDNHKKSEMDIAIMAFGMDNPIIVGKVDKNANFSVNLDIAQVSGAQASEENMMPLYFSFNFKCMDSNQFGSYKETALLFSY